MSFNVWVEVPCVISSRVDIGHWAQTNSLKRRELVSLLKFNGYYKVGKDWYCRSCTEKLRRCVKSELNRRVNRITKEPSEEPG